MVLSHVEFRKLCVGLGPGVNVTKVLFLHVLYEVALRMMLWLIAVEIKLLLNYFLVHFVNYY